MATELTVAREPDEAFLVFKKRGVGGILGVQPGTVFTITSIDQPDQAILAQVATPRDIALYSRNLPIENIADWWTAAWHNETPLQRFALRFSQGTGDVDAFLTAPILSEVVLPIITALSVMQRLLFGTEPVVREISQNSPVNISLEGAGGLYEKIATDVIPWRRERAQQIASLDVAQRRAQLEQKRAEVLAAEASTQRERAESEAAFERARQARAEADLKEVELTRARFQLAADMVERLLPDAPLPEKMQLISQLMPQLTRLTGIVELVVLPTGDST